MISANQLVRNTSDCINQSGFTLQHFLRQMKMNLFLYDFLRPVTNGRKALQKLRAKNFELRK